MSNILAPRSRIVGRGPVFAVSALLALAGCAQSSVIGLTAYDPSYCPGEPYAASNVVPVILRGNPYPGVADADSRLRILAAMQDQGFGQTRFTLGPAATPYRVILLFGAEAGPPHDRVCAVAPAAFPDPPTQIPATAAPTPVTGVLCRGDLMLAAGVGTIASGPPGDVATAQGIGEVVRILFPAHNPTQGGGGDQS